MSGPSARLVQFLGCCLHRRRTPRLGRRRRWHDSRDGGRRHAWTPQGSSTSNYLWGVTFTADGRRGWAVGEDGTIITTEDGGTHWTPQTSSTSSRLLGVAFAADGRRAGLSVAEARSLRRRTAAGIGRRKSARPQSRISRALPPPPTDARAGRSAKMARSLRRRTAAHIGSSIRGWPR